MTLLQSSKLIQGYKGNIFLIVQKVCDSYRTVADPCAQQHEEANPGLHFTALQSTNESKRNINKGLSNIETAGRSPEQTKYESYSKTLILEYEK